jgi:uncharacterized protein
MMSAHDRPNATNASSGPASQPASTTQPDAANQPASTTQPDAANQPGATTHASRIAAELNLRTHQVAAAIELLSSGNTLPFVARYRKEATGGLDDAELRALDARWKLLEALDARRATIVSAIEEQGQLTDELRSALLAADSKSALEDLYQPYKQKRKTRASVAREKGLQGLADLILQQAPGHRPARDLARPFVSKACPTADEALAGARDIVAETISDDATVRRVTREKAMDWGTVVSKRIPKGEDPREVFALYYDYNQRVPRLHPHQILAINRGEKEGVLRVKVDLPERDWRDAVRLRYRSDRRSSLAEEMDLAIEDAASRLLLPAIGRDVRRALSETAEAHAIEVFGRNLRALLGQPPLAGHAVMGIDPAFRTGCKLAVVDERGRVLATDTIYPHVPQRREAEALSTMEALIQRHKVKLLAIGNGTASRETEALVARLTREREDLHYLVVDESGASVYSASALASDELPDLDVSIRGAVSIARRVQDPMAELVKIDPRSIGVGLYQHDVDQGALTQALDGVVEDSVNAVGVDLNSASPALLAHVAGIGPKLAANIVAERDARGGFRSRKALKKVKGLGPKAFEQAAGFLRVREGEEPLDASAIHPESYAVARELLKTAGLSSATILAADADRRRERESRLVTLVENRGLEPLAEALGTGPHTLSDILDQLQRPGRDPREDLPTPILRSDVLDMDDLSPGLRLHGTVRNVVDFGAFVDLGVKNDGLIHRSQMRPGQRLSVGDVVEVEILQVEPERGRIGLGLVRGEG